MSTTSKGPPESEGLKLQLTSETSTQSQTERITRPDTMTPEEGDTLRHQTLNQVVFKEMSEQLSAYKNRCSGVETVTLMLKESKLEVIKLSKQCKVLETAVANLQNRLSTNGLSSSVAIEETELFVPGASKQTLDNLARENARLRSQLKSCDYQAGKKISEDMQELKNRLETLEAENNQLKAQLLEMEGMKIAIIQQYEMELKAHTVKQTSNDTKLDVNTSCKNTQTDLLAHSESDLDLLRTLLKQVSQQCVHLETQLQKSQAEKEEMKKNEAVEQHELGLTEEKFTELKENYDKVVLMNHRWQSHSEMKEREVHALHARISELEDPDQLSHIINRATDNLKKELAMVKAHLDHKEEENVQLRQDVERLKQEIVSKRSQPQFDVSIVEILKQQIQVCTEDFNTERKDREQAINRAKQLQEEVNKLTAENNAVKNELENLRKQVLQQQTLGAREAQQIYRPEYGTMNHPPVFRARGHQQAPNFVNRVQYGMRQPGSVSSGPSSTSPASSLSTLPSRASSEDSHSSTRSQVHTEDPALAQYPQMRGAEYMSLPRTMAGDGMEGLPQMLGQGEGRPGLASMPAPVRRPQKQKSGDKEEYMTCPKCNKEFSESQNEDLLKHMDVCTD